MGRLSARCHPSIKRCGSVTNTDLAFTGCFEFAGSEHAPTERVLVHGYTENRLVNSLQIEQGEGGRQQLIPDGGVVELPAEPFDHSPDNLFVIEGDLQMVLAVGEADGAAALSRPRHVNPGEQRAGRSICEPGCVHQRVVGNRDHPGARVAVQIAEGV